MHRFLVSSDLYLGSEADAQFYALSARYNLLAGNYDFTDTLLRRGNDKFTAAPELQSLHQTLCVVAGWRVSDDSATTESLIDLLTELTSAPEFSEAVLGRLGVLGMSLRQQPQQITSLADTPIMAELILQIGERMLPPTVEVALAEIWAYQNPRDVYPRFDRFRNKSTERGRSRQSHFDVVSDYLCMLEALRVDDIPAASAMLNHLYTADGIWLWLRCLDLYSHFGTVDDLDRFPWRLSGANEKLNAQCGLSLTHPVYAGLVYLPIRQMILAHSAGLCPFLDTGGLNQLLDWETRLDAVGSNQAVTFWQMASGASLGVRAFLNRCLHGDIPVTVTTSCAFPFLIDSLDVARCLISPTNPAQLLSSWGKLPDPIRMSSGYASVITHLMKKATTEGTALTLVETLFKQGVPAEELARQIPGDQFIAWFLQFPTPPAASVLATFKDAPLEGTWLLILDAVLTLLLRLDASTSSTAARELLERLNTLPVESTSGFEIGAEPSLFHGVCMRLHQAATLYPDIVLPNLLVRLLTLACHQGQHSHGELLEVLKQQSQTHFAAITAELWLYTGRSEYLAADSWTGKSTVVRLARAYHQLLNLREDEALPTIKLLKSLAGLRDVLQHLQEWTHSCYKQGTLVPFPHLEELQARAQWWSALLPLSNALMAKEEAKSREQAWPLCALVQQSHMYNAADVDTTLQAVENAPGFPWALRVSVQAASVHKPGHCVDLMRRYISSFDQADQMHLHLVTRAWKVADRNELYRVMLSKQGAKAAQLSRKATGSELCGRLQFVEMQDIANPAVFEKLVWLLSPPYFEPASFEQWDVVRKWRAMASALPHEQVEELFGLTEAGRSTEIARRLLTKPLRPLLIDLTNLLRSAKVAGKFPDLLDFVEQLWQILWAKDYYPILTYADPTHYHIHQNVSADADARFNALEKQRLVHVCRGREEQGTADYHILDCITRMQWEEVAAILTDDIYAKMGKNGWNHLFPWLPKHFDRMQIWPDWRADQGFVLDSRSGIVISESAFHS